MISVLVRRIMEECGLKQQELADVLGVPLARVKRLSGGTAQKWSAEEQIALTEKLGISPSWLITGQGEMFDDSDDESDSEFANRIQRINYIRELISSLPIHPQQRERLAAVMTGDPVEDAKSIIAVVQSQEELAFRGSFVRIPRGDEDLPWLLRAMEALSGESVTPAASAAQHSDRLEICANSRESELLRFYRNSPEMGKEALEKVARALSSTSALSPPKRGVKLK